MSDSGEYATLLTTIINTNYTTTLENIIFENACGVWNKIDHTTVPIDSNNQPISGDLNSNYPNKIYKCLNDNLSSFGNYIEYITCTNSEPEQTVLKENLPDICTVMESSDILNRLQVCHGTIYFVKINGIKYRYRCPPGNPTPNYVHMLYNIIKKFP